MNSKITPFEDIRLMLETFPIAAQAAVEKVRARDRQLTKPAGALGRLEEIVEWLAAWQDRAAPRVDQPVVAIFAGNHGVVNQGVSAFPAIVTQQMVRNFTSGGAAINQICRTLGIGLKVYELALEKPTRDFTLEPAMEERETAATLAYGFESIEGGVDLLALGEMGIGNTTSAATIYAALYGGEITHWVGRGTGVDEAGFKRKQAAIEAALRHHKDHLTDPLEILRRVGGREIAALMGAICAARIKRIPVVLDGYVVCAAAALLHALNPQNIDHCIAGHQSAEGGHAHVLKILGKNPLLQLDMRLGEGSGAALSIGLIKSALACHQGMATFDAAGVADKAEEA
jgi:nicotinate-nucleotide--dimethylbenzimidazole phosphoribosyltransferase